MSEYAEIIKAIENKYGEKVKLLTVNRGVGLFKKNMRIEIKFK